MLTALATVAVQERMVPVADFDNWIGLVEEIIGQTELQQAGHFYQCGLCFDPPSPETATGDPIANNGDVVTHRQK